MAYRKSKPSKVVTDAEKRKAGMIEIDTQEGSEVEYGVLLTNPCNTTLLSGKLTNYYGVQLSINQKLADADNLQNTLKGIEKEIQSIYTRVLSGAVSKFGVDASQVEMLGGTRQSERKRPVRIPPVV